MDESRVYIDDHYSFLFWALFIIAPVEYVEQLKCVVQYNALRNNGHKFSAA